MKYFKYISDSKIEMLYEQIAPRFDKEFSIGIDVKVFKLEGKNKTLTSRNLYSKLQAVIDNLKDRDLLGGAEDGKPYIASTMYMRAGGFGENFNGEASPIVFWGGPLDPSKPDDRFGIGMNQVVALAGSRHHVLGEMIKSNAHSHSLTEVMAKWFLSNLDENFSSSDLKYFDDPYQKNYRDDLSEYDVANATYLAATQMGGLIRKVEFVAKVLHRSEWPDGFRSESIKRVLLGSPLYVCDAE